MSASGDSETSVKVAVRVRPQNAREQIDMCQMCTFCTPDQSQIVLGKDKAFTYDYVFDTATEQHYLYDACVEELVSGCFEGFNATVLAYGQTGSGKTYSMGTGFDAAALDPDEVGVIPRAVNQIFTGIEERRREAIERNEPPPQYELTAQFLELYNEEIIDLFDPDRDQPKKLRVHEDAAGNIYVAGATDIKVESENETLECLKRGALSRSVGSTNMNAQSSRSHAIFSLHLTQQRPCKAYTSGEGPEGDSGSSEQPPSTSEVVDWEQLRAKFHFVDLAGSERLKRTGATGDRAKEGISINCGLLALGNVISALGDKAKRGSHVPYRDSKLTRLLQDSLGGNSRTLMIACISPTDRDFMETLNTLKYANRARNIKNKVTVNQDKTSQQLAMLRSKIQELELELQEFKSGRMVVSEDGSVVVNDMANEITMLRTENDKLRMRIKAMQQVVDSQASRIAALAAEKEVAALGHQDEYTGQVVGQSGSDGAQGEQKFTTVIQGYIKEIEELKSRLVMSESLAQQNPRSPFRRAPSMVRQQSRSGRTGSVSSGAFEQQTDDLLLLARTNIQKLREKEEKKVVRDPESHSSGKQDKRLKKHHSRENLLGSSDNLLESGGPAADKLHRQATASSFGSDEDSSNEDQDSDDDGSGEMSDDATTMGELSDDSDSDDSDTESLASSVAELSSEINLKQQLVDQLEKAQSSLYTIKIQYEEKVHVLQTQIKNIESERDKVLKEMSSHRDSGRSEERLKDIKVKYERQLGQLRSELKTMKSARKEHAKAMKKNAQHEKELKQLKSELLEMKKQRVKMLNKMRTEANQRKVDGARSDREMAQLRKVSRKKDNQIKSLQSDARRRELVLKRRQEELAALRRQKRFQAGSAKTAAQPSSSKGSSSGPVVASPSAVPSAMLSVHSSSSSSIGSSYSATVVFRQQPSTSSSGSHAFDRNSNRRKSSVFSSDSARKKWRDLERKILDAIMKRLVMSTLAKDMDRWIEKRDDLSRKMEDIRKQKKTALKREVVDTSELVSLDEDLDSVSAHIEYVQENIVELQNDLIALDDSKSDGDTVEAHAIITASSPRESKYLLEHLLDMVLDQGVKAGQRDGEVKSLKARLKASEQSAEIIKSFSSPQVSYPIVKSRTFTKSTASLSSMSAQSLRTTPPRHLNLDPAGPGDSEAAASRKLRRRTALPSELAPATLSSTTVVDGGDPSVSKGVQLFRVKAKQLTDTTLATSVKVEDMESADGDSSSSERSKASSEGPFPIPKRSHGSGKKKSTTTSSLEVSSSGGSCPTSPSIQHRGMKHSGSETNVWSRLANSSHDSSAEKGKGTMQSERESRRMSARLLTCTHTASGHTAGVLCVYATQNYLFSSSQDRTVKVWNLKTGTDLLTLDKHFSYVRCVRYCPRNSLIFTASQSLIKIWDMRHHRARCIKTFGPAPGSGPSSAETVVQDLIVAPAGDLLFSASGNFVNIWDLKKFAYCGRLVGHNGAVCALSSNDGTMVTGSRDRLIKLYDLASLSVDSNTPVSQPSVCTLYPPHYDAVTSFGIYKDLLFSSCGVTIKQWDIKERCLKHAVDGAHPQGNNINSLATLSSPIMPMLVSGCKGGLLKLWNPENCANIGEVSAHKSSINSIATNDTCIFSGSSDKTIRIWRPSPIQDN